MVPPLQCSNIWLKNVLFNPVKPEFTIVIFINYKPGIAVAIISTCSGWRWLDVGGKLKKYIFPLIKQFHNFFVLNSLGFRKLSASGMLNDASWGFKGFSWALDVKSYKFAVIMKHWPSDGLMIVHLLRWWPSILDQHLYNVYWHNSWVNIWLGYDTYSI